ncbi:MAG: succinate dehydrogenase [Polyangiaceae bacterium]|nr:succinate dehydrogenase [Polyangiaceae bacterium]
MSDPPAHAAKHPLVEPSHRAFLLRKLHSLSGVVPVAGFVVFHLWTNARALSGQEAFDAAVLDINHMPYLPLLEAGILLPLAFHGLYGVKLALQGRPNLGRYGYARNWMYTLQRASGVVALLFIVAHLWELRVQKALGVLGPTGFYPTLVAHLSSTVGGVPLSAIFYLVGIAACAFHLANGLFGFCASWGLLLSRRSQRAGMLAFGALGVAVFLLGANTTVFFATGSRWLGGAAPHSTPTPINPPATVK